MEYIFYTLLVIIALLIIIIIAIFFLIRITYKSFKDSNELKYKKIEAVNINNNYSKKIIEDLLERIPENIERSPEYNIKKEQLLQNINHPVNTKTPVELYNEANRLFILKSDRNKINEFEECYKITKIGVKDGIKQYEFNNFKPRVLGEDIYGRMFSFRINNQYLIFPEWNFKYLKEETEITGIDLAYDISFGDGVIGCLVERPTICTEVFEIIEKGRLIINK